MTKVSLGPFSVEADIRDFGVHIRVKLDFKVLDFDWEGTISATNPSIEFSTGSVAKFSGKISIGIDDTTGELRATGRICVPVYDPPFSIGEECESFGTGIKVLPAGGLCMLAQGVTKEGLSWFGQNYPDNVPTCQDIATFRKHASPELINALISFKDISANGQTMTAAICTALNGLGTGMLNQVRSLPPEKIEQVLSGVVTNPQVNEIYPGIAGKFGLTAEKGDVDEVPGDAQSVIIEIAEEIGVAIGLELAVATAVGAVVGAIVAVVGVTGGIVVGGVALTPFIVVALVIFLAVLLLAGIVLIPLIALVIAVALVLVEIFATMEGAVPRQSLLADA